MSDTWNTDDDFDPVACIMDAAKAIMRPETPAPRALVMPAWATVEQCRQGLGTDAVLIEADGSGYHLPAGVVGYRVPETEDGFQQVAFRYHKGAVARTVKWHELPLLQ